MRFSPGVRFKEEKRAYAARVEPFADRLEDSSVRGIDQKYDDITPAR